MTHFFAPAWRNPIVEVIRWSGLDPALFEYLRWVFCVTGKVPLETADVACFMLDRVFDNWCNEAAHCLQWATAAEVDSVAAEIVNAGPFFVLNMARGNPIIVETNSLQADEEGEHYRPAAICLLYTSDAADELLCVDLGGRRIIKKKKIKPINKPQHFTIP